MLRRLSGIIVIVAAVTLASIFLPGRFLVVGAEMPERTDLCHVLASSKVRTIYAARLYHQGLCGVMFLTGGYETRTTSIAAQQRAVLLDQGVPEKDIVIDETDVFSTYAEIERLKIVIENGALPVVATVSLVSEPYHMRRARMVATWLLDPDITIQMAAVPFDETPLSRFWLEDSHSRNTVIREYVKLVYYQLRYRLRSTPVGNWLVSLETVND